MHVANAVTAGSTGSIVICISPLTTVMIDQQAKFTAMGLNAEFVGEAQENREVVSKVLNGQLVFISPENLLNNKSYRGMLLSDKYKNKLVGLIVDEAHCVKTW